MKVGFGHQLLVVSLAYRKRAIPIACTWVKHVGGAPPYLNFEGDFSTRTAYIYDLASQSIGRTFVVGIDNRLYSCEFYASGRRTMCLAMHWGELNAYQISDAVSGELLSSIKPDSAAQYAFGHLGERLAYCREGSPSFNVVDLGGSNSRTYRFSCQDMAFLPGDTRILQSSTWNRKMLQGPLLSQNPMRVSRMFSTVPMRISC